MPSLWKKAKGNPISRLVSDFRSPEKRGGSLVVETGFPTSVVDLFVKNRDRLRKAPKKKRSKLVVDPPPPVCPYPLSSQSISPTTLPFLPPYSSVEPEDSVSKRIERRCSIDVEKEEIVAPEFDLSSDSRENDEDQEIMSVPSSNKRVLASVLKAAFVVILALCTKKLVVGITMAAFVLLLIEYVGDRVVGLLKPCNNARERWKSSFFRANFKRDEENGVSEVVVDQEPNNCHIVSNSCHSSDEILVADANLNFVDGLDELAPLQAEINRRSSVDRLRLVELEVKRLVMEEEERRGEVYKNWRKKKGNNFWKDLVPKKLHHGKKKKRNGKLSDSVSANTATWEEEKEEEEYEEAEREKQVVIDKEGSLSPPLMEEREKIEKFDGVNNGGKEAGKLLKSRNGSLMNLVMVMVVLVGLVRGRTVAVFLTVICFLTFKMIRSVTGIMPPINISS